MNKRSLLALVLISFLLVSCGKEAVKRAESPFKGTENPQARAAFDAGEAAADLDARIEHYTTAVGLDPQFAQAYTQRALAYMEKGEAEPVIRDCTKVIEIQPELPIARYNRASVYMQTGQLDEAIADLAAAVELDPEYADAYAKRAHAYMVKSFSRGVHDPDTVAMAMKDYDKAIELQPKSAVGYYNRGMACLQIGTNHLKKIETDKAIPNIDKVIADMTRAIELDPEYAEAYTRRADAYVAKSSAKGRQDKELLDLGLKDYGKVIELHPNSAQAYYNRGTVLYEGPDTEAAIADLTKAIDLDPNYAQAYNDRACAYGKAKQFDMAIKDFDKAIEIDPGMGKAYMGRALAHFFSGDSEKGDADAKEAAKRGHILPPFVLEDLRKDAAKARGETVEEPEEPVKAPQHPAPEQEGEKALQEAQ